MLLFQQQLELVYVVVYYRFKKFEELNNILKTLMKEYLID